MSTALAGLKTIIAGPRNFVDYGFAVKVFERIPWEVTEVVSGMATGVDTMGVRWAQENGIALKRFPANRRDHGRAAGVIRNEEMARYAEGLVAIWDGRSPGTLNMIRKAEQYMLDFFLVYLPGAREVIHKVPYGAVDGTGPLFSSQVKGS